MRYRGYGPSSGAMPLAGGQGRRLVPLGRTRPSGSLMSSVQRRDTAVTGGCRRRLSLMHMVEKGIWDRSSLQRAELSAGPRGGCMRGPV